jgi:ABC-type Fe3+-siderophore transport system permease subunit
MSLSDAITAFTKKPKASITDEIGHSDMTSTRLWAVVILIALVLWFSKGVLTPDTLALCFYAVIAYLVCNTLTKLLQLYANMKIKLAAIEAAGKGNLTGAECDMIRQTE